MAIQSVGCRISDRELDLSFAQGGVSRLPEDDPALRSAALDSRRAISVRAGCLDDIQPKGAVGRGRPSRISGRCCGSGRQRRDFNRWRFGATAVVNAGPTMDGDRDRIDAPTQSGSFWLPKGPQLWQVNDAKPICSERAGSLSFMPTSIQLKFTDKLGPNTQNSDIFARPPISVSDPVVPSLVYWQHPSR